MKRILMSLCMIAILYLISMGSTTQTVHLSFDIKDYSFDIDDSGYRVNSTNICDYYQADRPAIPQRHIMVATTYAGPYQISCDYSTKNLYLTGFKCEIIKAESSLLLEVTKMVKSHSTTHQQDTLNSSLSICNLTEISNMNGYAILHLKTSPFFYDTNLGKLDLIEEMTVHINSSNRKIETKSPISDIDRNHMDYLKSKVENPKILEDIYINSPITTYNDDSGPKYIIVTSSNLCESFKRLAEWKTAKGIPTEIITTEVIDKMYNVGDLQLKIKKCLAEYYKRGMIYTLLGGDDTIVPPRGCYASSGLHKDYTIPTDIYYSCFGGDFEWDVNKNGIYGERDDGVDLIPSIYLSRLPVRSNEHVQAYISKLISYESNPKVNNTMLMGGMTISVRTQEGISDAEIIGDKIYSTAIEPYWTGNIKKLYPNPIEPDADGFHFYNLHQELSKGYSIVNIDTHGEPTYWYTEGGNYSVSRASGLKNIGHTLIVTSSCFTNGFDSFVVEDVNGVSDPCLSEEFIRSQDSGVIGYWGSSRYSWGSGSLSLGASHIYNQAFFSQLFKEKYNDKNFGTLAAYAKISQIGTIGTQYNWLQYSINPIGDPEMQIYTGIPQFFNNISVIAERDYLRVTPHVDSVKMCLQGYEKGHKSIYHIFSPDKSFNLYDVPEYIELTFSKQNYAVKKYSLYLLQNQIIDNLNLRAERILIGADVNPTRTSGNVIIKGSVICDCEEVTLAPGTTIEKGGELLMNMEL